MGTLTADSPDYTPMPNVVLESIRLGLPPLLVAAMLVHTLQMDQPMMQSVPVVTCVGVFRNFGENPHIHSETGDPTPHGTRIEIQVTTGSGPDVPFIPMMDDSANIIRLHAQRRHAGYLVANAMSSTSSPALWAEAGRRSTSD